MGYDSPSSYSSAGLWFEALGMMYLPNWRKYLEHKNPPKIVGFTKFTPQKFKKDIQTWPCLKGATFSKQSFRVSMWKLWDFKFRWAFFFSDSAELNDFFLRWYVGLAPGVLFGRIGLGSQDSQNPDQKTGGGGVVFLGLRVLNRFSQLHKKAWARFLDGPKIVYRKVVVKLMDQGISRVWVCQLTFICLYIYIDIHTCIWYVYTKSRRPGSSTTIFYILVYEPPFCESGFIILARFLNHQQCGAVCPRALVSANFFPPKFDK